MKPHLCLLLFISISFFFLSCKKNKPAIDQLPPETQTGAGTFGCLVDGKVFKPKGDPFGGRIKSCAYQFINSGYYLQFFARKDESETNCQLSSVSFGTDSMIVQQGKKYRLVNRKEGFASGKYTFYSACGVYTDYITKDSLQGELNISKLDEVNHIISGTFWFDAVSSNGEKVQVREGRFDMSYTL